MASYFGKKRFREAARGAALVGLTVALGGCEQPMSDSQKNQAGNLLKSRETLSKRMERVSAAMQLESKQWDILTEVQKVEVNKKVLEAVLQDFGNHYTVKADIPYVYLPNTSYVQVNVQAQTYEVCLYFRPENYHVAQPFPVKITFSQKPFSLETAMDKIWTAGEAKNFFEPLTE